MTNSGSRRAPAIRNRCCSCQSQETNALPDVDSLAQTIATLGNQQYAGLCRLLHAVDGALKRVGIVTGAVCMRAECLRGEIHRARVGRSTWVKRRGVSGCDQKKTAA